MFRPRLAVILSLFAASISHAETFEFKHRLAEDLAQQVPVILRNFDPASGRLGKGIWICQDQNDMFPLAVAYSTPGSKYYRDAKLLEVIARTADPLIANMDANGKWTFRKKDNSTWGQIRMPWTYSRWIRTYMLVKDDLPPEVSEKWKQLLTSGYEKIGQHELTSLVNIPTHHAMGLYVAGKALERPEWCQQASEFLHRVIATQAEGGYWEEGSGPVVTYNFVYVDALGVYYSLSRDPLALTALSKAAEFHEHFTYPDGSSVETIDQRNPYHAGGTKGNVGFTFSPAGRRYLQSQWERLKNAKLGADAMAAMLAYGEEGPLDQPATASAGSLFVLRNKGVAEAATYRQGPWFVCVSALTTPLSTSRWIQDRQNFVSIYHDKAGLILGGANTKLQPAWSNFTFGDMALLQHKSGDSNPDFVPKPGLIHIPSSARLVEEPLGVDLTYGEHTCRIHIRIKSDRRLEYTIGTDAAGSQPLMAHLTLLPRMKQQVQSAAGQKIQLGQEPFAWTGQEVGGVLEYNKCRLHLPAHASVHWPALPHNPYRKDGHAEPGEGRIEVRIPFEPGTLEYKVDIEVE